MPSPTHESGAREILPPEWLSAFDDDLSRYGAAVETWPAESRRRAERVLASSVAARADLEEAALVEEFLNRRAPGGGEGNLAERIFSAQRDLVPAMPASGWQPFIMLQVAFIVAIAAIGLLSGRWIMTVPADYDVSGIYMICADAFYL
ncbi:MAG: hypothetical protein HYU58_00970 [Proteobacteria bacterium]|nr:hypothetical protein [Pseudomonadota bacterium]